MAAIREIKPGEDPSTVFAEMNNSNLSSDEDYDDSDDDLYEDDEDDDLDVDDGRFDIFGTLTDGCGTAVCTRSGKIRVSSCPADDVDNVYHYHHGECAQCACEKHKKILSFMDACVKLGFQLLSSDFDKSFKPLQNAFNSNQKSTPIKQLNGVALSVKRVCNYALEQTYPGYIEKFKKFIQKEMIDTDYEHIEYLIELHFDMKENFDCYSKNYSLLLLIASQLKPAYNEAVSYRTNSKAFKESQAIDRFLKTQQDIKCALVHYEKVLLEIKEKFDERHDPHLEMPSTPESTRDLMNGSYWTNVEIDAQQGELESSSEHIDLKSFELELEKENLKYNTPVSSAGSKNKKNSKNAGSNDTLPSNESSKSEKPKKSKKKQNVTKERTESSPSADCINLIPRGNVITKEKLMKSVHCTTVNCERSFKGKKKAGKVVSNNSSRERSGSSTRKSGTSTPLSRIPTVEKLKNSCLIRNFDCCEGKLNAVEEINESVDEDQNVEAHGSREEIRTNSVGESNNSDGKDSSSGFRPEDYLDESDGLELEDMTEFITVNSKRNNKSKAQSKPVITNTYDAFSTADFSSIKKNDPILNDDFSSAFTLDKIVKGRNSQKFENKFYSQPIGGSNFSVNGPIEPPTSDAFSALSSTTNTLTVSQKMQALMSDLKPNPAPTEQPKTQPPEQVVVKKTQDDEQSKVESVKTEDKTDSKASSEFGNGSFVEVPFGNGPLIANKIKPISKPVATVDPCKLDASVVTTSAKSVDNWNPIGGRFSEIGVSEKSLLEPPLFQGYSPFNGTDRLQAVQDSMAQYTKSTGSALKPNEFENSSKEPLLAGSDLGFSAFQNGSVYAGIFSNPGNLSNKDSNSISGRLGIRPPGFDFGSDLIKIGQNGRINNQFPAGTKSELSPDLDLKSNLNPTASVFNPTVANAIPKEFFPSANPPGPLFQRSNSTPDTPFLPKTGSSNFPSGLPTVSSIPSRAKEESASTSKFFPAKSTQPNISRVEILKVYKQQMHFHLRYVNSVLDNTKSKAVLLEKLKTHTTHIEDMEISSLLQELQARVKELKETVDLVYCTYKHNVRLLSSYEVSLEQLFPITGCSESITTLSPKLERLFSTISFS